MIWPAGSWRVTVDPNPTFPCGILSRFMSWIWLTRIWSMLIRDSTRRCRSFAAWYSAFSRRSPSSRARLISRGSSVFNSLSSCWISSSNFFNSRAFTSGMLAEIKRGRAASERRREVAEGDRERALSRGMGKARTGMSPVQQPRGIVAIARARQADVGVVMATFTDLPLVLVLAGLQDPGNVGAIIRAASAFGASGVVAIEGSANPFGWKALRGGMGGTFRLPIAARGSLSEVVASAHELGVRLVAAVPRGGTPLPLLDLRAPTAIVLRGEGAGVPEATL